MKRTLLIVLILAIPSRSGWAMFCPDRYQALGKLATFWRPERPRAEFSWELFAKAKEALAEGTPSSTLLDSLEGQAAFLEKATGLSPSAESLESYHQLLLKILFKPTRDASVKLVGRAQLENALASYYAKGHGAPDSLVKLLLEGKEAALKRWVLARVELSIAKEGAAKAFAEMGILKKPGLRVAYHKYIDTSISPLFDAVCSLPVLAVQAPVFFPKKLYLRGITLPLSVRQKIAETGVESAYPEIKALFLAHPEIYGSPAHYDYYWNMFRNFVIKGSAAWYAEEAVAEAWGKIKSRRVKNREVQDDDDDMEAQFQAHRKSLVERAQE